MKAVIPSAGEGIRLRPLTLDTPKQLLELHGKPILEHIFDSLPDEIDEIILVVGYLGDKIIKHFGDNFRGRKIKYAWQKQKRGTWDALLSARKHIGKGKFLMLYGDDIIDKKSIKKLLKHELAVLAKEVPDPRRFGVVVKDKKGRLLELVEKPENPKSKLALTGVKILDERIFLYPAAKHKNGEFYITDSVSKLAKDHAVIVEEADTWLSIATPEELARLNEDFKNHKRKF